MGRGENAPKNLYIHKALSLIDAELELLNLKFGSIYDKIGEVFTRKPYNLTKTLDALRNAIAREDRKRKNK